VVRVKRYILCPPLSLPLFRGWQQPLFLHKILAKLEGAMMGVFENMPALPLFHFEKIGEGQLSR